MGVINQALVARLYVAYQRVMPRSKAALQRPVKAKRRRKHMSIGVWNQESEHIIDNRETKSTLLRKQEEIFAMWGIKHLEYECGNAIARKPHRGFCIYQVQEKCKPHVLPSFCRRVRRHEALRELTYSEAKATAKL